jgi:hypothetical protein
VVAGRPAHFRSTLARSRWNAILERTIALARQGKRLAAHMAPPVHMMKLTERQEITPYKWVRPDEERTVSFHFGQ